MGVVSATDANRNFSKLLRQVEAGERMTITKPVAVLSRLDEAEEIERENARRRLMEMLREGIPIGYSGPLDRDALHER